MVPVYTSGTYSHRQNSQGHRWRGSAAWPPAAAHMKVESSKRARDLRLREAQVVRLRIALHEAHEAIPLILRNEIQNCWHGEERERTLRRGQRQSPSEAGRPMAADARKCGLQRTAPFITMMPLTMRGAPLMKVAVTYRQENGMDQHACCKRRMRWRAWPRALRVRCSS